MDRIVRQIQAQSGDEKDLKTLQQWLNKQDGAITKHAGHIDSALASLDPALHAMGICYLLEAKLRGEINDLGAALAQCEVLLSRANRDQVHLVPRKFTNIGLMYASLATSQKVAKRAVLPLRNAVSVLRTTEHTLTPLHAAFLQVCLSAKVYSVAARFLSTPVYSIGGDPDVVKRYGVSTADVLSYHYYGGLVYTGLKRWPEAMAYFETAFTAPALVLSAIMLAAYKKHILVSLVATGRHNPTRSASSMVSRHLRALCQPYNELVTAFATKSAAEVAAVLEQHAEAFQTDGNLGLAKQCHQSLINRTIRDFTETYITLSLPAMVEGASLASPADATARLLRMIQSGHIHARIDQREGMVSFFEASSKYDTTSELAKLDGHIHDLVNLYYLVREQDEAVATSAPYIQRTQLSQGGGLMSMLGGGGDGGDAMMMMAMMQGMMGGGMDFRG